MITTTTMMITTMTTDGWTDEGWCILRLNQPLLKKQIRMSPKSRFTKKKLQMKKKEDVKEAEGHAKQKGKKYLSFNQPTTKRKGKEKKGREEEIVKMWQLKMSVNYSSLCVSVSVLDEGKN